MQALTGARVFDGTDIREGAAVLVDGGQIAGVIAADDLPAGTAVTALRGGLLAPGFIDVQVNGGGGTLFNGDPSVDGIRRIAAAHRRFGTTGLLPTVISDTPQVMAAAIAATEAAIAAGVPGVLGIHVEGPFLAPERRGVHAAWHIRPPEPQDLDLLAAPRHGHTMVTLAPEMVRPGTIARLAKAGVTVCLGHTDATHAAMLDAVAAGARGVTHLFNAMRPLGSREPGAVGAALFDPRCWCGVIADIRHVHPASLAIAIAAKPRRIVLVTDAMPPVGGDGARFTLYGEEIVVEDGTCVTAHGQLAGSALDMATAVRNVVDYCGVGVEEALRMASLYPACLIGLGGGRGRIAPGYHADLVLLDDALRVQRTWIAGIDEAAV